VPASIDGAPLQILNFTPCWCARRASTSPHLVNMSKGFIFKALPAEIRVIIYKLAFVSHKPLVVGATLSAPQTLSSQLLRTCRSCHEEGSSVLYRENIFSMDVRHSYYESEVNRQIEELIRQFERLGKNVDLIRNLQANLDATPALNRMRSIRGFRCMLQNLDSLKITFSEHPGGCGIYYISSRSRSSGGPWYMVDLHAWLKVTRGPFQNLTRIFVERNPYPVNIYATGYALTLHLFSNSVKVEPSVKSS
jgi:hypothetical protein